MSEIKDEWKQYKGQIICTFLIFVVNLVLGLMQEWGIGFALLVAILVYDFVLMHRDQDTITKWSRRQLPGLADKIIMAGLFLLIVKFATYGDGWGAGYWFILGTINGHINWDK